MTSLKQSLLIILLILVPSFLKAQQYAITHYTRDKGLPGNQVFAIFQDSKGYMWFSTSAGLIKYNGKDYKIYTKKDGLLEENPVSWELAEDKEGGIWMGFTHGVSRLKNNKAKSWKLKETTDRFGVYSDIYGRVWIYSHLFAGDIYFWKDDSIYNFSNKFNFKEQNVANINEDNQGAVYFFLKNGKIFRYLGSSLEEIKIEKLSGINIINAFFNSEGKLILCSNNGLGVIDKPELKSELNWIFNKRVEYCIESHRGSYWVATEENGLYVLNNLSPFRSVRNITINNGLISNNVRRIFEDKEGDIWIGHPFNGISKISSLKFSNYKKENGFPGEAVLSITKYENQILCGTDKGLLKFKNNNFQNFNLSGKDLSNQWVMSFCILNEQELLLGTSSGFYIIKEGKIVNSGLLDKYIITFFKDHNGKIWIGTDNGLYTLEAGNLRRQEFSAGNSFITKIEEINNRNLFVGTSAGLLIIQNGTIEYKGTQVIHPADEVLSKDFIYDIQPETGNNVLISAGRNLIVYNEEKGINYVDILNGNTVCALYKDTKNRIWAGSDNGLYQLQKTGDDYSVVSTYTQKDGIASNEFTTSGTIYEDKDGKIYFGTYGGITIFDPEEEYPLSSDPSCYVTDVMVNDSLFSYKNFTERSLSYSENKISFLCDGLSFYNEDAVRFEYYIYPLEKEWANFSNSRLISYGYLEPNDYKFYVRCINQFGNASQPQVIPFSIASPFWRQFWFIGLSVLLVGLGGYQVNRVRRMQIKKRNIILEGIVEEKTKDLKESKDKIEESKNKIEEQYKELIEAQKELVEKRELEKAHTEIKLLKERLAKENIYLREERGIIQEVGFIIGRSPAVQEVRKKVAEIAGTASTVLITGETGVGKNLIAEAIHGLSDRKDRALITVNCAAIPDSLVESELFGHEKGAFTGAHERRIGKFEVADGSTIFLDEIGDMPLSVQAKVLNILQSKIFTRVGSNQELKTDVRILAATNHNLSDLVMKDKFRQDLYYRINVYSIHIPPLRERKEDIEPIAKYFIDKYAKSLNKKITAITKSAMTVLHSYTYPGNIRELENIINRAVIVCKNGIISDEEIILQSGTNFKNNIEINDSNDRLNTLESIERDYIIKVLERTGGKISGEGGAAQILGMNRSTLQSRMDKLGIKHTKKI